MQRTQHFTDWCGEFGQNHEHRRSGGETHTEHLQRLPNWLLIHNPMTRVWIIAILNTLHVLYQQMIDMSGAFGLNPR